MKPRAIETAVVRSLHAALAPVGTVMHMTPGEADVMVSIGRAERIEQPEQEPYKHRMMVAQQPQARKRGGK